MGVDSRRKIIFAVILSYLTLIGITTDLKLKTGESAIARLLTAMGGFSLTKLFLFAGLCTLYICAFRYIEAVNWTIRERVFALLPAFLFAGFMVVGYSFAQTDSLDLVLQGNVQRIKALIAFGGYGIIFAVLIAWLYAWLQGVDLANGSTLGYGKRGLWGQYKRLLRKAPFRTVFVTLFILYIPYTILSYPAILMGDSYDIIAQGFNFPEYTSSYLILMDESVKLNGHHPIVHTQLVHICLVIGNAVFGSYNVGIFLVSLVQLFGMCTVAAASIQGLTRVGVQENILLALIAYFAFAPRMQNYCSMNFSVSQGSTTPKYQSFQPAQPRKNRG